MMTLSFHAEYEVMMLWRCSSLRLIELDTVSFLVEVISCFTKCLKCA